MAHTLNIARNPQQIPIFMVSPFRARQEMPKIQLQRDAWDAQFFPIERDHPKMVGNSLVSWWYPFIAGWLMREMPI
jgi:hypothetical protein